MKSLIGFIIGGLIGTIIATSLLSIKSYQRINSLESRVQELEKSRGEILSYKKDQIQFNTFMYQTLIVNRGKAL